MAFIIEEKTNGVKKCADLACSCVRLRTVRRIHAYLTSYICFRSQIVSSSNIKLSAQPPLNDPHQPTPKMRIFDDFDWTLPCEPSKAPLLLHEKNMAVIRKSYAGQANMPCFLLKWRFVEIRWSASFPPTQALRFPGQAGTFPYTCVENNRDCKGANVCLQPILNPALQTKPRAILLGMYARLSNSEYGWKKFDLFNQTWSERAP